MKVPSIVQGNVCHNGGVNAIKKEGAGVNVVNKSQRGNVAETDI